MLSKSSQQVADKAKTLYEQHYRAEFEAGHSGEFLCIEPESKDCFLGATFDEAVNKAIDAHPERLTYTLRIGHPAAFHLGMIQP